MNESEATRKLCAGLARYNAKVYAISGGHAGGGIVYQRPGMPDRFLVHAYVPGGAWLEFKIGTGRCSEIQRIVLREMRERGANAFVCRHGPSGAIEDENGHKLCTWDGTAEDLLDGLEQLCRENMRYRLSVRSCESGSKSTR